MQAMRGIQAVASGRVLSAGALLVLGAGLALFHLTSLVLGPAGSRQLDFSLTIPAVDGQDLSESPARAITVVVGTGATAAAHATQIATPSRAAFPPTTEASSPPLRLPSSSLVGGVANPTGKKHRHDR